MKQFVILKVKPLLLDLSWIFIYDLIHPLKVYISTEQNYIRPSIQLWKQ